MAWTHKRVLYHKPNSNVFLLHYGGQADGSDLTDYALFDISADAPGMAKTQIDWLRINAGGVYAFLEWDATTDDFICAAVDGGGPSEFPPPFDAADLIAGNMRVDPASTGTTGDIVLTTLGGAAGDGVVIDAIIRVLP